MSFQNLTWLWWTLPLIALPVIIHLINRYRHRTVQWAAMRFLLDAKRMTSGMARLRQVLILTMRTLAVAGLVFAVARPLASGWLGSAIGGAPDTVMVLLDRSASMEQTNPQTGISKRASALAKLGEFLETTGQGTRLVLVESTDAVAREIDSVEALLALPETQATAGTADIPAMLKAGLDYLVANQSGRTDVWVCSDLRAGDWDPGGGRWEGLRAAFAERETVRFFLLNYPDIASDNLTVGVDRVSRREYDDRAELMIDLRLSRAAAGGVVSGDEAPSLPEVSVPVAFVIDGARSVLEVDLAEGQRERVLQGHVLPIDRRSQQGWGKVELPGDGNAFDNAVYFVYAEAALRRTVIVSDDAEAAHSLQAAAGAMVDPAFRYEATVVEAGSAAVAGIDWEATSLVIWQGALPEAGSPTALQLEEFVRAGRSLVLLPPSAQTDGAQTAPLFGVEWGGWRTAAEETGTTVANWRRDSDWLADTADGAALPLGELRLYRWRELGLGDRQKDATVLARLAEDAAPLLVRMPPVDPAASAVGGVVVGTTLPQASHSNLAREGIVLFALIHRALADGAEALAGSQQRLCGRDALAQDEGWQPIDVSAGGAMAPGDAETTTGVSSELGLLPGVFRREAGGGASPAISGGDADGESKPAEAALVAVNRPPVEDGVRIVDAEALDSLFAGLEYERIEISVDDGRSLVSEVWRAFLIAMAIALVVEAILCMPSPKPAEDARRRAMGAGSGRDKDSTAVEGGATAS